MNQPIVLVDAHVHVHPGADVGVLLSAASQNFARVAHEIGAAKWQGVLMLTEMKGTDWFGSVLAQPLGEVGDQWTLEPSSAEEISVQARQGTRVITVVAGRQVATLERLEVLALGTRAVIPDGRDLHHTIEAAQRAGAITVLPWAVGKWSGARGRLIAEVFASPLGSVLFAGDNSGRPVFWPEPSTFALARSRGRPLMPGTDPLPLKHEESRVGSYGFWMHGELPANAPAAALNTMLREAKPQQLELFGQRESTWRFFRNQLKLRMPKPH